MLTVLGLVSPDLHTPMTDANVNLEAGPAILAFRAILLALAWRKSRRDAAQKL